MADQAIVHPSVTHAEREVEVPSGATVRMVGPDGEAYDIPEHLHGKAFADGLREERSLGRQALDLTVGNSLLQKAYDGFTGNGPKLGDVAAEHGQQVLIGEDGHAYVMPAEVASKALADSVKQGAPSFRLPDLAQQADRLLVAEAEAGIDPRNEGFTGSVNAATDASRNQFVKTVTFGAVDPEKDALTETDRASFQRAQEMNPVGSAVGNAAGFVGGIVADPLAIGGVAAKLGKAAEGAVASKALGAVAKGAAEGLAMSAPSATRHIFEGDPEKAGEALLAGVGIGSLFGGGNALAGSAKRVIGAKAGPLVSKVAEGAEQRLARLEGKLEEGAAVSEAEALAEKLTGKAGDRVAHTVTGVGGIVGGMPGYVAGKAAGALAEKALESDGAQKLLAKAAMKTAKQLERVGPALDKLAQSGAVGAAKVGSLNAMAQLIGEDERLPRDEQYKRLRDKLAEHADPAKRADALAEMASAAPDGDHSAAYTARASAALDYLNSQLPRTQKPPGLFQGKDERLPGGAQMAAFERKVQVVRDPFCVVDELAKGTLTADHVHGLEAVYPALAFEFRERVLRKASEPNAPQLPKAARDKLALLLGQPLDDSASPDARRLYQSMYAPANDNGQAPAINVRPTDVPAAQMTPAQRIAAR